MWNQEVLDSTSPQDQQHILRHCFYCLVHLHAQLSRATVTAQFGHLIGLLSLSQYACAEGESIYCPTLLR